MRKSEQIFSVRKGSVSILPTKAEAGQAAAAKGAQILRGAIAARARARIVVGTGNSQIEVVDGLAQADLPWEVIEIFHMDEYIGLAETHPASFRRWLRTHLVERVHPKAVHYLNADAVDLEAELARYEAALDREPIDVCFMGFGENGHIAFNDPHVADFEDPLAIKVVALDELCRRQQVGEGHFPNLEAVPLQAATLTCPALLGSRHLIVTVPERRKAEAVRQAIEGPRTTRCPASAVFDHPSARVYLDSDSASLLTRGNSERS